MIIYGASGHGKVIKAIAASRGIEINGFVDDYYAGENFLNLPILKLNTEEEIIFGLGDNSNRKKIAERYISQWSDALIHNAALVNTDKPLGKGTVVMPAVIVNEASSIGNHCIINTAAVVEHDCTLGDYVHLSPNATLSGNVTVGEGTHIGAGAVVIPGITIGKWVVVGAGAVIINDIPDYATVVGNPGRTIKIDSKK